jgi:hypothetical protein
LIENGDDTKAATKGLAKFDLNEAMGLLKLRSREGLGLGPRGGAYPAKEDGIEAKIMALASKELPAAQLKTQAADLEKAAYVVAALAHVSEAHTPARKVGAKDPKDWAKFTEEMKRGSMGLAAAVKKGSPAEVKKGVATRESDGCAARSEARVHSIAWTYPVGSSGRRTPPCSSHNPASTNSPMWVSATPGSACSARSDRASSGDTANTNSKSSPSPSACSNGERPSAIRRASGVVGTASARSTAPQPLSSHR